MDIKNIMVAGAGTLGSQIAWQSAFYGYDVTVFDIDDASIEKCKLLHKKYAELFKHRGEDVTKITDTFNRISYSTDLQKAVENADLVSESVPENPSIKGEFYQKLSKFAPENTIFTTNSSTMLPSEIVPATNRPEKFLALHFANGIWDANIAEIMGHSSTDENIFNSVVEFAKSIGMVPISIKKEQRGYVLNSLLIPLLDAAGALLVNDVTDYESIDKTWMIATGSKMGPCGIFDLIGMETVYNVAKLRGERGKLDAVLKQAEYFKTNFIDKGKLGITTGEGFYKYPNPKYQDDDFLKS